MTRGDDSAHRTRSTRPLKELDALFPFSGLPPGGQRGEEVGYELLVFGRVGDEDVPALLHVPRRTPEHRQSILITGELVKHPIQENDIEPLSGSKAHDVADDALDLETSGFGLGEHLGNTRG